MNFLILYGVTLPVLVVLDVIWIGGIARGFYKEQYGPLLSSHPVWWAAAIFYLIYAAGLVFFVIRPAIGSHSLSAAALTGLFLGLLAYGTYDLTNLATIPHWPLTLTAVDMAWGTFASGATASSVYLIATLILGF